MSRDLWRSLVGTHADKRTPHMGVTFWDAAALDALVDPRYDDAYARDVFCELRTPTLAFHAGYPVETVDLPGVRWHAVTPGEGTGIWHAVKG